MEQDPTRICELLVGLGDVFRRATAKQTKRLTLIDRRSTCFWLGRSCRPIAVGIAIAIAVAISGSTRPTLVDGLALV